MTAPALSSTTRIAARLRAAATAFLESLTPKQRLQALRPFLHDSEERKISSRREHVGPFPLVYGAHPATVIRGSQRGLRPLREEEELARALLRSLDATQQSEAIVT